MFTDSPERFYSQLFLLMLYQVADTCNVICAEYCYWHLSLIFQLWGCTNQYFNGFACSNLNSEVWNQVKRLKSPVAYRMQSLFWIEQCSASSVELFEQINSRVIILVHPNPQVYPNHVTLRLLLYNSMSSYLVYILLISAVRCNFLFWPASCHRHVCSKLQTCWVSATYRMGQYHMSTTNNVK